MTYPPSQKPPIWSIDPGVIAYNCQKAGMPHPVLAMPMWEGGGNLARDYSGHGNHGTINGADWVASGLYFVGSDYINIPGTCGIGAYPFTLVAGIKTTTAGVNRTILDIGYSGASVNYAIWIKNANVGEIFCRNPILRPTTGSINITDGVEHQIIGVYGSAISRSLYVDGLYEGINENSITYNTNSDRISIGRLGDVTPSNYLNNDIVKYVYIFNTDLSASQIKFLSDNPYFMYQIPEELYGYVAAAAGISIPLLMQQMNQFDGGTYALC